MNFDQRAAYQSGREAATFLETVAPRQEIGQLLSRVTGRPGLGEEIVRQTKECGTRAQKGHVIKVMVKVVQTIRQQSSLTLVPTMPAERFEILQSVVNMGLNATDGEWAEVNKREKQLDRKELAAGVPLDDLLPSPTEPEDEFWLRGFEEKLTELRAGKTRKKEADFPG